MRKPALALAVALAFTASGIAVAQTTTAPQKSPGATQQDSKLDRDTRQFIEKAAEGGMAEVELGKLASQKASNTEVKQFGQMMATDHGKSNQQLMQVASRHGVTPPTELEGKHKRTHDKLSKLSGAEFDREYMDAMVKDHKEDIELYEKQAKNGKTPDVKSYAESSLPILRAHLKKAEQIQSALKNGGKSGGRS